MFYVSLQNVIEIARIAGSTQVEKLLKESAYVHKQAIEFGNQFFVVSAPKLKGNDDKVVYIVHSVNKHGEVKNVTGLKRLSSLQRALDFSINYSK